MTTFRIKLVETTTTEGTVEFPIVAGSAAAAAAIVSEAYGVARQQSLNVLSLPDGQSSTIEPSDMVERTTKLVLIDEAGADLRIITPQETTNGPH
ncbi:MAG: hypothetical protein ACRYHQ_31080 [Janthinobacterium lividum]